MKQKNSLIAFGLVLVVMLASSVGAVIAQEQGSQSPQSAIGTAFTYQGQLKNASGPITDHCDFEFSLWDSADTTTGQISTTQAINNVAVSRGLFTVALDFGASAFTGEARWLQIAVKCGSDTTFTPLTPRQLLTPAPYALALPGLRTQPNATSPNVIGGYRDNAVAPGVYGAVIAGGGGNGVINSVSAHYAAIGGGNYNTAGGVASTVPGGDHNIAQGDYSFAGGQEAQANHTGSFVWADASSTPYASTGANQFDVRATGGVNLDVGSANTRVNSVPLLPRALVPTANTPTTVDSAGLVGWDTSLTIGADGLPVVSYHDNTNGDLKVLHCGNVTCISGNVTTTVDSVGDVGSDTSITIGADGLPMVSYFDGTNNDLKVLHCGNVACTSSNISTTVDSTGYVGDRPSLAIGADGLPVVSYHDNTNGDLKVLHCGDVTCTNGNVATTVDSAGSVGSDTSITIGADGLPMVSYFDGTNNDLKVLHCGDAACTSSNISTTVDSTGYVGYDTSLTIGADGLPVVSYRDSTNSDLKVLHCGNVACTSGNISTTVDSAGLVGWATSLTIGADGLPVVSYLNLSNGDLKMLHCGNATCTSSNVTTTVDSAGNVGSDTSITIGADGLPVISHLDLTNGDLKVLHCANPFCTPYFRRR